MQLQYNIKTILKNSENWNERRYQITKDKHGTYWKIYIIFGSFSSTLKAKVLRLKKPDKT